MADKNFAGGKRSFCTSKEAKAPQSPTAALGKIQFRLYQTEKLALLNDLEILDIVNESRRLTLEESHQESEFDIALNA